MEVFLLANLHAGGSVPQLAEDGAPHCQLVDKNRFVQVVHKIGGGSTVVARGDRDLAAHPGKKGGLAVGSRNGLGGEGRGWCNMFREAERR